MPFPVMNLEHENEPILMSTAWDVNLFPNIVHIGKCVSMVPSNFGLESVMLWANSIKASGLRSS